MQEEQHDQGRSPSLQELAPCSIAFFGHDAGESTIIKRVTAFQAHGCNVLGFMFRRERGTSAKPPQWENVDLGPTVDRNYLRRVPKLAAAVVKVLQHRRALARCQALYARNIDMLLIALASRRLTGSRALVVYEVLDVQRVFVGGRPINKLFRWAERRMLGVLRSAGLELPRVHVPLLPAPSGLRRAVAPAREQGLSATVVGGSTAGGAPRTAGPSAMDHRLVRQAQVHAQPGHAVPHRR